MCNQVRSYEIAKCHTCEEFKFPPALCMQISQLTTYTIALIMVNNMNNSHV